MSSELFHRLLTSKIAMEVQAVEATYILAGMIAARTGEDQRRVVEDMLSRRNSTNLTVDNVIARAKRIAAMPSPFGSVKTDEGMRLAGACFFGHDDESVMRVMKMPAETHERIIKELHAVEDKAMQDAGIVAKMAIKRAILKA